MINRLKINSDVLLSYIEKSGVEFSELKARVKDIDLFIDGEKMHSRTAFAKFGTSGYAGLKALFPDKEIKVMDKERKHVFVYDFYNCT